VQDVRGIRPLLRQALQGATAEEVRKKEEANFCDHFKPREGAFVAKDGAEVSRAKSALDDLFKK